MQENLNGRGIIIPGIYITRLKGGSMGEYNTTQAVEECQQVLHQKIGQQMWYQHTPFWALMEAIEANRVAQK